MEGQKTLRRRISAYDLVAVFQRRRMIQERTSKSIRKGQPLDPPRVTSNEQPSIFKHDGDGS